MAWRFIARRSQRCSAFVGLALLLFTYLPGAGRQPDLLLLYRVGISIEVDGDGMATLHLSSEWSDSCQISLSDYQVFEYQTPTWSPDGSKIAFTQNCYIRVVDVPNICPQR